MNGVIYYVPDTMYIDPLYVSIWSLRQYYQGSILVYTVSSVFDFLNEGLEGVADLELVDAPEPAAGMLGVAYECLNQCLAINQTPFEHTVFLHCDTLVQDTIDPLFDCDFGLTKIQERGRYVNLMDDTKWARGVRQVLNRMADESRVVCPLIQRAKQANPPLINIGVMSFSSKLSVVREWLYLYGIFVQSIILDELLLLALMGDWISRTTFFGSEWNAVRRLCTDWTERKRIRHFNKCTWPRSEIWREARQGAVKDATFSNHHLVQRGGRSLTHHRLHQREHE